VDPRWLAVAFALVAVIGGLAAGAARSLVGVCLSLVAVGASAACVLLLRDQGDAALAMVLVVCGWAPLLLLGGLLLSVQTTKPLSGGRPWLSVAAACTAAAVLLLAPLDFDLARNAAAPDDGDVSFVLWMTPLIFVMAIAAIGLLGYGERGALEGDRTGRDA
jgi:hypothetical protein